MKLLITIGGREIIINDTIFNTVLVVILLSIFAIYTHNKFKNADPDKKPVGFINIIEALVEAINNLVRTTMERRT